MIKRLIRRWREWRINRQQKHVWHCEDIAAGRPELFEKESEQIDAYIAKQTAKLGAMRRAYYAGTTTEQIERTVLQRARGY